MLMKLKERISWLIAEKLTHLLDQKRGKVSFADQLILYGFDCIKIVNAARNGEHYSKSPVDSATK
jgi:aryl carrier-like protein